MEIKFQYFFDRPAVLSALDRSKREPMSKMGAYVMTTAKRSMRTRKRPAAPGSPPSVHVGLLRQLLFFSYDPVTGTVPVGPILFRTSATPSTVPEALEYGKDLVHWKSKKLVRYNAFPFMRPSLALNMQKYPSLFRDAIR